MSFSAVATKAFVVPIEGLRVLEQQAVIIPGCLREKAWALGGRALLLSGRCSAANIPGS